MLWRQYEFQVGPFKRGFHKVTDTVVRAVEDLSRVRIGGLHLFLLHTSASIAISENADPSVQTDLEMAFDRIAPESFPYEHTAEGSDDMPAHVKSALLGCSLQIPVRAGGLVLGTWQGIFLCEHRHRATARRLVATLQGVAADD